MNRYKCTQGHFTSEEYANKNCPYDNVSAKELSEMLVVDIPEQKEREQYRQVMSGNKSNTVNLTSQEWSIWFQRVAENKKLGYWAETLSNGDALLRVETEKSSKLVITGGTFEKPKAKAVFTFSNSDKLNDAIGVIKKLW